MLNAMSVKSRWMRAEYDTEERKKEKYLKEKMNREKR